MSYTCHACREIMKVVLGKTPVFWLYRRNFMPPSLLFPRFLIVPQIILKENKKLQRPFKLKLLEIVEAVESAAPKRNALCCRTCRMELCSLRSV